VPLISATATFHFLKVLHYIKKNDLKIAVNLTSGIRESSITRRAANAVVKATQLSCRIFGYFKTKSWLMIEFCHLFPFVEAKQGLEDEPVLGAEHQVNQGGGGRVQGDQHI
jgi:hypothetical protein